MLHSIQDIAGRKPLYGRITGPIVMIGCGSIGCGTLPLIERHFEFDPQRFFVIEPSSKNSDILKNYGIKHIRTALNESNLREILEPLLLQGGGQGFCVNLSVDVYSLAVLKLCREIGSLYIDTAIETWPKPEGDKNTDPAERTNYALREAMLQERREKPGGATAVSSCGANPGLVSWLVKEGLLKLCTDLGISFAEPQSREDWALLMQRSGVKGIHIAERDTQETFHAKQRKTFFNTWSIEGMIAEGNQPAELGWGTHEKWAPSNARFHKAGCQASIYLTQPGAKTLVRSWSPTSGAQYGFLISHNEAISIADYFTVGSGLSPAFRPTVNFAYHPCNDAVRSIFEMLGNGKPQKQHHLMKETEITEGRDELGVLLYGHAKNAYWYGSQLTIEETRALAPYQNATGLQVSSGVLAGMAWALENPASGIVETDDMDYRWCLDIQKPYLGTVRGYYTDWTPQASGPGISSVDADEADSWQFKNVLVHNSLEHGQTSEL